MSVIINTNYAATIASDNLAASSANLQKSLNRLSSGQKIATPADDAGGLAVAMKLSAANNRSAVAANNISNAVSFLQTQDGVLNVASKVLDRMSQLAILHLDTTKNASDLANYSTEFTQLNSELSNLTQESFNGNALFGSSTALIINTNEAGTQSTTLSIIDMSAQTTGLAIGTLSGITTAIQSLATDRAKNGASQSTLGFSSQVLTINQQNLAAATSRIMDVDVASESTQLARFNVLVQSGTAMLAQANQSAQTALKLLG